MEQEKREAMELLLSNRLFLYSLMHKLFGREPDRELLDILTGEYTGAAFGILSEKKDDMMDRAGAFLGEIQNQMKDDAFLDKVKSEYTRLFIGPGSLIAPPWESVYGREDAMLFQKSTLEVRNTYRKYGLMPEGYPHVADDSLALELHFMTLMAQRSLEEFNESRTEKLIDSLTGAHEFLRKHLLVWIPKFLERMKRAESSALYPQMCLILDDFLKKDAEIVCEVLESIKGKGQ